MACKSSLSFGWSVAALQQNHCLLRLYSTRMGILGELPRKRNASKITSEVAGWQAADSTTKQFLHI
jgi:hypothetical protein